MENSSSNPDAYRRLQQHLDRLPVGFPASGSGADIRLLQHIFTPVQARIAACLSLEPRDIHRIFKDAGHLVKDRDQLQEELTAMVKKGGLEIRIKDGKKWYTNTPLVVGMYELQVDRLTPEFIRDFKAYTAEKPFGISFLSTPRPQMRTIPVNKSITPELSVADYHRVSLLLDRADPPFVILPCICRRKKSLEGEPCRLTRRTETCLAMGSAGQTLIEMGVGRKIDRQEARAIIRKNQEEGLVLQPANTRQVEFICSCCGCCCSMLGLQKELPLPLDFWASDFKITLDKEQCIGCGKCISRCQTLALTRPGSSGPEQPQKGRPDRSPPRLNPARCIGCGLCVPACPSKALTLVPRKRRPRPPANREALNRALSPGGPIRKAGTIARLAKGIILTGDLRLLRSDPDQDQ